MDLDPTKERPLALRVVIAATLLGSGYLYLRANRFSSAEALRSMACVTVGIASVGTAITYGLPFWGYQFVPEKAREGRGARIAAWIVSAIGAVAVVIGALLTFAVAWNR